MKKNSLQELGWALGVMLLPVLYAIWVYQTLPENLAIHFDLSGKGNGAVETAPARPAQIGAAAFRRRHAHVPER